jgi:DNA/RNA-binding domain of Phe-tRNA-synthetase-like protein
MTDFILSEGWNEQYPEAFVGILGLRDARNVRSNPELAKARDSLTARLRVEYGSLTRQELQDLPEIRPYIAHYRRYKKTYHVLLQLESVVFKGKSIPGPSGLVEAMFLAELEHHLLTAGHDLAKITPQAGIYVSDGTQSYTGLNGELLTPSMGDPFIADASGILSNVIYGPAERASIALETRDVLYTVYTFPGAKADNLLSHLETIHRYVLMFSPGVKLDRLQVLGDDGIMVEKRSPG